MFSELPPKLNLHALSFLNKNDLSNAPPVNQMQPAQNDLLWNPEFEITYHCIPPENLSALNYYRVLKSEINDVMMFMLAEHLFHFLDPIKNNAIFIDLFFSQKTTEVVIHEILRENAKLKNFMKEIKDFIENIMHYVLSLNDGKLSTALSIAMSIIPYLPDGKANSVADMKDFLFDKLFLAIFRKNAQNLLHLILEKHPHWIQYESQRYTLNHISIFCHNDELLEWILINGKYDINKSLSHKEIPFPLSVAVHMSEIDPVKCKKMVSLLLAYGADPDIYDPELTGTPRDYSRGKIATTLNPLERSVYELVINSNLAMVPKIKF